MKLWVVGARGVKWHKEDYAELYLRGFDNVSYGPVCIPAGQFYVSRRPCRLEDAEVLRARLVSSIPGCSVYIQKYGAYKHVVWLKTGRAAEHEHVWREFSPLMEKVGVSERLTRLGWPSPVIECTPELEEILKLQRKVHDSLGALWAEKIVPLIVQGARLDDCVRWLRERDFKAVLRYSRDRKGLLEKLASGFSADFSQLDSALSALESKCVSERAFAESGNDSLNTPIYLNDVLKPRHAFASESAEVRKSLLGSAAVFDFEMMHWWTDNPTIFSVSLVSDSLGDVIYGLFPSDNDSVSAMGRTSKYVCVGSEAELLALTASYLRKSGLRITQNGLGYDYGVADRIPGRFLIGCDNSPPLSVAFRRGLLDEHGRKASRDAVDFDMAWFGRAYLRWLVSDCTLESLAGLGDIYFGTNVGFQKIISYDEQADLVEKASAGDKGAMGRLNLYNHCDSVAEHTAGMKFVTIPMGIAESLGITYFDAFHETPKNIALIAGDRQNWNVLNLPRDSRNYREWFADQQKRGFFVLKDMLDSLHWDFKRGNVEDVLVAYYPLWAHARKFVSHRAGKLEDLALNSGNPLEAFAYYQVLDGFVHELIADTRIGTPDSVFLGKYGAHKSEVLAAQNGLKELLEKAFSGCTVVNRYHNLFFVRGIGVSEAWKRGLVPLGVSSKAINVDRGEIVHCMNNVVLSTGISIPSRKRRAQHPGSNSKCALGIMAVRDFVEKYFSEGLDSALSFAHDLAAGIRDLPPELLAFRVSLNEPLEDMGVEQQQQRRALVAEKYWLKPGESIIVGMSKKDGVGDFEQYDPAARAYMHDFVPDYDAYLDENFGRVRKTNDDGKTSKRESTLFRICKALVIPERSPSKNTALEMYLTGRSKRLE
ncbi:MAG: hypothetical protein QXM31_02655 [Candidatus Woesearchaeota archaeon]